MRYIKYFLGTMLSIFCVYSAVGQEISTECTDGDTSSPVSISEVRLTGFSADGTSITDEATIVVPNNTGSCFENPEVDLKVDAGAYFEFDVNTTGHYLVVVDWNGDGFFNIDPNSDGYEVVSNGVIAGGTVTGSFLVPQDGSPVVDNPTVRIIVADNEDDLDDSSQSRSVQLDIFVNGNGPRVAVSKTGNAGNGFSYVIGNSSCYAFTPYADLDFYINRSNDDDFQFEINQITISSIDPTISETYTVDFSNDELVYLDQNTPYRNNTRYTMDEQVKDAYQFSLKWQAIQTNLPATLQAFPNDLSVLKITIEPLTDKNGVTLSEPAIFYIGCCDELDFSLTENQHLPLYVGTHTTVEFIGNTLNNRLRPNESVFVNAGKAVVMETGVYTPQDAIFVAEVKPCARIPQLRGGSGGGALSIDTAETTSSPEEEPTKIREALALKAFPNPFNDATTLEYKVKKPSLVQIELYDMQGRRIETLLNTQQKEGVHQIDIVRPSLSAGMYLCKLAIGDRTTYLKINKS